MDDLNLVIQQLRQIVGGDHVVSIDDEPAARLRRTLASESNRGAPKLVVRPDSVAQVQAVVQMAGTLGVSVAMTPNAALNGVVGGGGSKDSIVLDLRRMNKVIEFNSESGYALVEPGVSFDQLRAHIADNGAGYWVDTDANGAHSVSGSITERAFGYTPYGDHLLMQCGMELVQANGGVMRTGMGALPGSDTWQLFKYNYGPYLDGLYSRSDFALVTKMGLWLMPVPPTYFPFMVSLPNRGALLRAIEILRPLKIQMVVPNTVVIAHKSADQALLEAAGDSAPSAAASHDAEWHMFAALYGAADNVGVTWEMVSAALSTIVDAKILTNEQAPDAPVWPLRAQLMRGEPAYSDMSGSSNANLWFSVAAPIEAEAASAMLRVLGETLDGASVSFQYEFALTWRTMFLRVALSFGEGELAENRALALTLIERLHEQGYAVSHDCRELRAAIEKSQTQPGLQQLYASLGRALDPSAVFAAR